MPVWFHFPLKIPTALCAPDHFTCVALGLTNGTISFSSEGIQNGTVDFCMGPELPHSSQILRPVLSNTLLFFFQEGLVSAFILPLANRELLFPLSLIAAVFHPLPVFISAWHQWTRVPLPRIRTWVNQHLAFSPRAALHRFQITCCFPVCHLSSINRVDTPLSLLPV